MFAKSMVWQTVDRRNGKIVNIESDDEEEDHPTFVEEMELSEIADAMGMPVNTVKTHLHRAVKSVRTRIGGARV